jgi:hypothetical protein
MTTEQRADRVKRLLQQSERQKASLAAREQDAKNNEGKALLQAIKDQKKQMQDRIDAINVKIAELTADKGVKLAKEIELQKMQVANRTKETLVALVELAPDKAAVEAALGDDAAKVAELLQ